MTARDDDTEKRKRKREYQAAWRAKNRDKELAYRRRRYALTRARSVVVSAMSEIDLRDELQARLRAAFDAAVKARASAYATDIDADLWAEARAHESEVRRLQKRIALLDLALGADEPSASIAGKIPSEVRPVVDWLCVHADEPLRGNRTAIIEEMLRRGAAAMYKEGLVRIEPVIPEPIVRPFVPPPPVILDYSVDRRQDRKQRQALLAKASRLRREIQATPDEADQSRLRGDLERIGELLRPIEMRLLGYYKSQDRLTSRPPYRRRKTDIDR